MSISDSVDHRLPGSSGHRILQPRVLEQIAIPSFSLSSRLRDGPQGSIMSPESAGNFFTTSATWEAPPHTHIHTHLHITKQEVVYNAFPVCDYCNDDAVRVNPTYLIKKPLIPFNFRNSSEESLTGGIVALEGQSVKIAFKVENRRVPEYLQTLFSSVS